MVDTFASVVRQFFEKSGKSGVSGLFEGKTDLKSAYRQVPIMQEHMKFAYFNVYNREIGKAQIYRLKTLPFGATHSVDSF